MKRSRTANTSDGVAQAFADAADGLPDPPKHVKVRPKDMPFWEAIVCHRPKAEWNEVQLAAAAQLARTQSDIESWSTQLALEDPVVYVGKDDTPKVNPLLTAIETATRRELALFRALGISATGMDAVSGKKRAEMLKKARETREKMSGDPLLAS